mmetsp:Transcript_10746/g.14028  ORF Transcript_10746/g.14028 Transcript_10746/m.14028 type:complete len:275 (+) Transcript_10746:77-901(+)
MPKSEGRRRARSRSRSRERYSSRNRWRDGERREEYLDRNGSTSSRREKYNSRSKEDYRLKSRERSERYESDERHSHRHRYSNSENDRNRRRDRHFDPNERSNDTVYRKRGRGSEDRDSAIDERGFRKEKLDMKKDGSRSTNQNQGKNKTFVDEFGREMTYEQHLQRLEEEKKREDERRKEASIPEDERKRKQEEKDRKELESLTEEEQMQRLMGFGGFSTSKGKKVEGNDTGAARGATGAKGTRVYRQYMNRRGGFNKALDPVPDSKGFTKGKK